MSGRSRAALADVVWLSSQASALPNKKAVGGEVPPTARSETDDATYLREGRPLPTESGGTVVVNRIIAASPRYSSFAHLRMAWSRYHDHREGSSILRSQSIEFGLQLTNTCFRQRRLLLGLLAKLDLTRAFCFRLLTKLDLTHVVCFYAL